MSTGSPADEPATFGALLRHLRRRARLTQRELGIAVGYSEAQISRLECGQRTPDPVAVGALFPAALRVHDPAVVRQLVELARDERQRPAYDVADLPPLPTHVVPRAERLAALRTLLDTERRVVLCGLPGAGKTTLATMLARDHATRHPVCWLTLTAGVTDSVDTLVRRLAIVLVRHGRSAAQPLVRTDVEPPLPLDERLRLLASASTGTRPLLCLDNGQSLADNPALLRVITHLAATTAIEVLVPSRVDLGLPGAAAHQLGGLDRAQARALIELLGGLPAELVEPLYARTGGSPMLLRLALGQLRAGRADPADLLARLDSRPEVGRFLVATTVGELSPAGRKLLDLITVFRTPVDPLAPALIELCQAHDGPYDVLAAAAELQHRQLLELPHDTTPHPLIRDRVRTELAASPGRARRLHAIAAAWRVATDDVTEAIWHHLRAGAQADARALLVDRTTDLIDRGQATAAIALAGELRTDDWAIQLARGDLLAQTEDAADAEHWYRQAMATAPTALDRARVAGRLAEHCALRGRAADALALCRAVTATGVDAARLATVECRANVLLADYPGTLLAGDRALALLDTVTGVPPREIAELTARTYTSTGQARRRLGDRAGAAADLDRAARTARVAGLRTLAGRALFGLAGTYVDAGRLDAAEAGYAEVIDVVRSVGDFHCLARVLHAQGVLRHYRGDPAAARALHEESLATKARIGDLGALAISRIGLAQALLALGEPADAERALAEPTLIDDPWLRAHALDTLGMIRLVADGGLSPAARETLAAARKLAESVGADPQMTAMTAIHTAVGAVASGDPATATRLVDDTPTAADVLPIEAAFVRGAIALVRGENHGVVTAARRITELVAATGHRMYLPAATRLRASMHRPLRTETLPAMLWVIREPAVAGVREPLDVRCAVD